MMIIFTETLMKQLCDIKIYVMQYSLTKSQISSLSVSSHIQKSKKSLSLFTRFFDWCAAQEGDRFLWMALSYFTVIGLALPATAYSIIFFGGNSFTFWIIACALNVPVLVLNLAALPTKIILPALIGAWIADAILILYCITLFMMQ